MPTQLQWDKYYLKQAFELAKFSYAVRLKVGCLIVKDGTVISQGYNGTPAGWDNNCEYKELLILVGGAPKEEAFWIKDTEKENYNSYQILDTKITTKPEVIHAEVNALGKLLNTGSFPEGATMYLTDGPPCPICFPIVSLAKLDRIVYARHYRQEQAIKWLEKLGVKMVNIPIQELYEERKVN